MRLSLKFNRELSNGENFPTTSRPFFTNWSLAWWKRGSQRRLMQNNARRRQAFCINCKRIHPKASVGARQKNGARETGLYRVRRLGGGAGGDRGCWVGRKRSMRLSLCSGRSYFCLCARVARSADRRIIADKAARKKTFINDFRIRFPLVCRWTGSGCARKNTPAFGLLLLIAL